MRPMDKQTQEIQKKVVSELQKYFKNPSGVKEYTQSMQEISLWLEQKVSK